MQGAYISIHIDIVRLFCHCALYENRPCNISIRNKNMSFRQANYEHVLGRESVNSVSECAGGLL